jgi:hypothetical protein
VEWYWVVLAIWYLALGYVTLWNRRSRPTWHLLDAYPLRLRIWMFLPFTRSWRARIRPEHRARVFPFRRRFLLHCYGIVLLPPILLYGWLYTTHWLDYTRSLERRAEHRRELFEILARRALLGDRAPRNDPPPATPDGVNERD